MAPLEVSDRFSLPARVLAQLVHPWVLIMFPRERAKLSWKLWRRDGKRKESLQLRLSNLNSSSTGSPSDLRQSARSGNERECK